ncbi:MAG: MFS transporter [Acidimicrobiales bacterium]
MSSPSTVVAHESTASDLHDERSTRYALLAAVVASFIVTFDAVVVNVALPRIRTDLGGGINGLQWIVDGYTLMFAALLLTAGAVTDRAGARRAFIIGVTAFTVASIACGLAPGLGTLIAARIAQGSAAALMMPACMALISHAYPDPARRAHALALWGVGGAIASSSGPLLGGVLTVASWRLIFLVNLPVGIAAVAFATKSRPSPTRDATIDATGTLSAIAAMGGLTYGAIEAGVHGITAPDVLAAFATAVVGTVVFVRSQQASERPMVPLELFGRRNVVVSMAVGFAFVVGYYGLPFVMSLYLQQRRGLTPFQTGLVFLPMMLTGAALVSFAAIIARRFGSRRVIITGLALMAAGLVALAATTTTASPALIAALMALPGLAGPLIIPPITAILLNSVPDPLAGAASGVFNTSRQLGGALAIAIFGALLAHPTGIDRGMSFSLLIAAAIAVAAALATTLLRPATASRQ